MTTDDITEEDEDDDDDYEEEDDNENNEDGKPKYSTNGDLEAEDYDESSRWDANRHKLPKIAKGSTSKKGKKKKIGRGHRKPKLKHWELMALEQSKQEPCNCRHHVMRLEADQLVYDWCRCKDHQHKHLLGKPGQIVYRKPVPPAEPKVLKVPPPPSPSEESMPTPPPPPRQAPQPKPRKVRTKSVGIDATDTNTTQIALAYDPAAVDYDMVQEVIYYRTSSGRLVKVLFSEI